MDRPLKETVTELLAAGNRQELVNILDELQPFDIAGLLFDLDEKGQLEVLGVLSPDVAAESLEHLDYDNQYRLLDHLDEDKARAIIAAMSGDALVDLIGAIHPRQAREIMRRVPEKDLPEIQLLMSYPENSAGGRMTLDYLAVRQDWTVDRVIAHFRKVGREVKITNYVYVVDREGRLAGVASMRDVLLSDPGTPVSEIMYTKVVSVEATSDQEEAAKILSQYDFVALPVVNGGGRLVGVITVDDVLDVIEEEDTEDIQRLGGSQPLDEPYMDASSFSLFRKRIGWLLVLFIAESLTGNILRYYEGVLSREVALTFFIPLLIDTGGNSGSQASTLVIRAMALGEVTLRDFLSVVWKEIRIGAALGLTMAGAAFAFARLLGGDIGIGLTVSVTLFLVVIVSSVVGAILPILGKRLGVDPAVVSAPLITTIVDGTGLLIYFEVARMILGLGR